MEWTTRYGFAGKIQGLWVLACGMVLVSALSVSAQLSSTQFEDISAERGIAGPYYSWGSSWGDPNADGLPDLFTTHHYREKDRNNPGIFYQQPDGTFIQDSLPHFRDATDMHGSTWMDFDGDGDDDLYVVTGRVDGNLLLVNDGSGVFTNGTLDWNVELDSSRGRTPLWFDANRDGQLDLFVTNGKPLSPVMRHHTLMLREGDRFVTSLADSIRLSYSAAGNGAFFGDPWGNGWVQFGLFTDNSIQWMIPGCIPLGKGFEWMHKNIEQVVPADFNGDGLTDLLAICADQGQANVATDYPLSYKELFGIHQLDPEMITFQRHPVQGSASVDALGNLRYTPDAGYLGMDSLTLRVCDSFATCRKLKLFFEVSLSPAAASPGAYRVAADSLIDLNVPKVVHPFDHGIHVVFNPKDSLGQGLRFRSGSDSLLLVVNPETGLPVENIRLGSAGLNPTSNSEFLLSKAQTIWWGAPADSADAIRELLVHYESATDEWVIRYFGGGTDLRMDLLGLGTEVWTATERINFSEEPVLSQPLMLYSTGKNFEDVTLWAGLGDSTAAVAGIVGDYDNDGDVDIFFSCGLLDKNQPNILYENLGNGQFVPVPMAGGAQGPLEGSAGTPSQGDLDGDGFLDLFLENGRGNGSAVRGTYTLLRNQGNSNHWLRIRLRGSISPLEGIGAVLELHTGEKRQVRIADGGQNRYSQSERIIHFGLGEYTAADSLIIRWSSGIVQRVYDLPADQVIEITEPEGTATSCLNTGQLRDQVPDLNEEGPVVLNWMETPCALGYQVGVRKSGTTERMLFRSNSGTISLAQEEFERGVKHYWTVRVLCQDSSWSNWAPENSFKLQEEEEEEPSGWDAPQHTAEGFRLQPNPASLWVDVIAPQAIRLPWTASLLDNRGILRREARCEPDQPCRIATEDLEPGLYSVRIQAKSLPGTPALRLVVQSRP